MIAIREVLSADNSGAATITLNSGVGTQVDDLIVAFHTNNFFTAAGMVAPTGTAGTWTLRETADFGTNNSHIKVWTRPVTVAGTQTTTVAPVSNEEFALTVFVLSGVDLITPVDTSANSTQPTGLTAHNAPSITTTVSNTLLTCAVVTRVLAKGTYAPPTGMTERSDVRLTTNGTDTFAVTTTATEDLPTPVTTGTRTFTFTPDAGSTIEGCAALSIAFKPTGIIIINQAVETNTAQVLTAQRIKVINQAVENDTAQAVTKSIIKTVNLAIETDIAQFVTTPDHVMLPHDIEAKLDEVITVHLRTEIITVHLRHLPP